MSWLSRLAQRMTKGNTPGVDRWFLDWLLDGKESSSGQRVSARNAGQVAAVSACVRVVSEDIAKLPLPVYRRKPNGDRDRATDHWLWPLLNDRANSVQTSFEWREMMQSHLELRGNAYSFKELDGRGRTTALWPLHPDRVQVLAADDRRQVFYRIDGKEVLPGLQVLHLRGRSDDGLTGLSPIAEHREAIGLALATQDYGGRLFDRGTRPSGGVEMPVTMTSEQVQTWLASWKENYAGRENAHKTLLLAGGAKWFNIGLTNDEAQFLETRKYQRSEIASVWRLPPHKIGDLEKATFSNIEHQALEYVQDSLLPRCRRVEARIMADLLLESERSTYFVEHLIDGLLRGDFKTRMEGYAIGRNWGWLSANDIRRLENMAAIPNGDSYLEPLNMWPTDKPRPEKASSSGPAPTDPNNQA